MSASAPALDDVYEVSESRVREIMEQVQYVSTFGEFMNARSALDWPDAEGSLHAFPEIPYFLTFAKSVMRYVHACRHARDASLGGYDVAFPDNHVSIG